MTTLDIPGSYEVKLATIVTVAAASREEAEAKIRACGFNLSGDTNNPDIQIATVRTKDGPRYIHIGGPIVPSTFSIDTLGD
jgi:hypothetical protein